MRHRPARSVRSRSGTGALWRVCTEPHGRSLSSFRQKLSTALVSYPRGKFHSELNLVAGRDDRGSQRRRHRGNRGKIRSTQLLRRTTAKSSLSHRGAAPGRRASGDATRENCPRERISSPRAAPQRSDAGCPALVMRCFSGTRSSYSSPTRCRTRLGGRTRPTGGPRSDSAACVRSPGRATRQWESASVTDGTAGVPDTRDRRADALSDLRGRGDGVGRLSDQRAGTAAPEPRWPDRSASVSRKVIRR